MQRKNPTMIRYRFIENLVLNLYSQLPELQFPIQPKEIINCIQNCRYLSYDDFAKINDCSIDTVIEICESISGCSQYDISNDRYLVICNEDQTFYGNTIGRQRWTCAHEIGHIMCNHFPMSALQMMSENSIMQQSNQQYEQEADCFASVLLAPFPLFDVFGITSPEDVQLCFGLSRLASENRYESYVKWKVSHINRAWNNDIKRLYNQKGVN